jgi:hypothetical protein
MALNASPARTTAPLSRPALSKPNTRPTHAIASATPTPTTRLHPPDPRRRFGEIRAAQRRRFGGAVAALWRRQGGASAAQRRRFGGAFPIPIPPPESRNLFPDPRLQNHRPILTLFFASRPQLTL